MYELELRASSQKAKHNKPSVHGANMGPMWGWQDPDGPHLGLMKFAIWGALILWDIMHLFVFIKLPPLQRLLIFFSDRLGAKLPPGQFYCPCVYVFVGALARGKSGRTRCQWNGGLIVCSFFSDKMTINVVAIVAKHGIVRDEITLPFPNFNGATVEV